MNLLESICRVWQNIVKSNAPRICSDCGNEIEKGDKPHEITGCPKTLARPITGKANEDGLLWELDPEPFRFTYIHCPHCRLYYTGSQKGIQHGCAAQAAKEKIAMAEVARMIAAEGIRETRYFHCTFCLNYHERLI